MNWKDLRREWSEDQEWAQAFEEEYPFRDVAMAIVKLRTNQGLTQAQLAEMVGTQQSVISRVESGQHSVEVDLLNRIARAVGTTWRPVFGTEEAVDGAAERAERPTLEPNRRAEPQGASLFLPEFVRIVKMTSLIPSPVRSQAPYEFPERTVWPANEEHVPAKAAAA